MPVLRRPVEPTPRKRTSGLAFSRSASCQKPNYAGQRAVRLGEKSDLPKFVLLASAPGKLPEMQQAGSDGSQITAAHLAG
jgi:hypothetical protein